MATSAERVRDALEHAGLAGRIRTLPTSTRSAVDAANAVGCEVAQIAKSLVFRTARGEPVMVVASGANRVDEAKVAALLGEPIVKADAAFVREHTGFAIGGVAPLAHPQPMRVLIDRDLGAHARVLTAAGTPNALLELTPAELLALSGGQTADVSV